uniref:Transporter n=1 Tax=Candidatus Kentrum sp. FM TaxID=2126340 RepID=A0A450WDG6_9GAMM|nr:MAG: neurotransmitter:Na+ symporter, NSS family [Candidatus Kentron sp. FM]VFJ63505.1 MAG: neurotransmitter:Na+ symporter, NSS family [Candidatus Kentron sp. FM]VFK15077.1 MAG: neurotransmitter:Na+ symporter, NSS family [Candidatus Kentron sp. FM]
MIVEYRNHMGANNTGASILRHEHWSSRLGFILAATGSAVGLGNIWKFPYITGENGGGVFVLVYLICIALIGLPIMMSEVLIGRRGQRSPIHSMRIVASSEGVSSGWQIVGWSGVIAGFIILSFYSVIAGWSLAYIFEAASGVFVATDAEGVAGIFENLLENPARLLFWHTVFMGMTIFVVAGGIRAGIEKAVSVLMPAFFLLMLVLVGYAALATDTFGEGAAFLFRSDFSKLSGESILLAMGQAFFSLSLGMGVMLAYGSYLPKNVSIGRSVFAICVADTLVALIAGLAIFPLVFAHGLEPNAGPGLIFETLPLAFGQMGGGVLFGTLFFVLLVIAGWTSSISILEPTVQWMEEHFGARRITTTLLAGGGAWLLGLATVFSFNLWAEFKLWDKTPFHLLDYLASNIMLPLGGLLFAIFAGWIMAKHATRDEFGLKNNALGFRLWRFLVRYVSPVGIGLVMLHSLGITLIWERMH